MLLGLAACGVLLSSDPALLFLCCVGSLGVGGIIWLAWTLLGSGRRRVAQSLAELEALSPYEFELAVGRLMEAQGYRVRATGRAGDQGVDLIAERGGIRYAVQVKQYSNPVDRKAVSDAVAAMALYGCNASMVVTNNRFRQGARELAAANGTVLVDRSGLETWIRTAQGQADAAGDNGAQP